MSQTSTEKIQKSAGEQSVIKTKRMLLAEVYVHKKRRRDANRTDENEYEVYHIYELEENENKTIVPKLSTNCTEPGNIIKALRNSSGSEKPQLKRLIERLCLQSMYFIAQNLIVK